MALGTEVESLHVFVPPGADSGDPNDVGKNQWTENHQFAAGAVGQRLVRDPTQTHGASCTNADTSALTNATGGALAAGDVVALSAATDVAVALDDTQASLSRFVVALAVFADAAIGPCAHGGPIVGVKAQGAIARGRYVRKSATTKAVEDAGVAMGAAVVPPAGGLGIALTAAAGGLVSVMWFSETAPGTAATTDFFVGATMPFPGAAASVPAGWLVLDGAAVSRTTFAALFALIGTVYGVGDGATTFNLPDYRGRAIVGVGLGGGLAKTWALGEKFGEENHVLSIAEMPTHTHTPTSGTSFVTAGAGTIDFVTAGTNIIPGSAMNNTGGGSGHNTIQPSIAANWIVKV